MATEICIRSGQDCGNWELGMGIGKGVYCVYGTCVSCTVFSQDKTEKGIIRMKRLY
jgi:hypothetical protein